jgi:hypothetical protein
MRQQPSRPSIVHQFCGIGSLAEEYVDMSVDDQGDTLTGGRLHISARR